MLIRGIGRLFTATAVGVIEGAAVLVEDGHIAWMGEDRDAPSSDEVVDAGGALVTPGLIDAHTHPVYAGDRHAEIAARSAGLSYRDLGADAGIGATVRATRAATDLHTLVRDRLVGWLDGGATTVEVKTGYHLERGGEVDAVRILASLADEPDLPDLHVTFLGAHAPPPETTDLGAFADEVASWTSDAAGAGADACDVFCDAGYFTVDQARRVLGAGADAGLQVRIHADELERTGGAQLAAELGAASADHLLQATADDARALAAAGVVATLCPGTALSMGQRPDVAALREAGVTIALGSDHNPGTCGITDVSQVVALAVAALGLSVDDALAAATAGGAASLQRHDRGRIAIGRRADLVRWDADHEGAFAWAWGLRPLDVWVAGREVR